MREAEIEVWGIKVAEIWGQGTRDKETADKKPLKCI